MKTKKEKPIVAAAEAFVGGESLTTLFRNASSWFVGKKGKFRRAIIAQLGGKEKYREVSDSHAGSRQLFGGQRRKRGQPAVRIDDSTVKRLNFRKLKWSALSGEAHAFNRKQYFDLVRRLKDDEPFHKDPELNRTLRIAMRDTKNALRDEAKQDWTGYWQTERIYEPVIVEVKGENGGKMHWRKLKAVVYVSPKGRRYVEARSNEKATLIIDFPDGEFRKEMRLRKFEDSGIARRMSEEKEMIERGKQSLKETRKRKREARKNRKKKPSRRSA